jgi:uncharacterized protein (TIGR02265 family)
MARTRSNSLVALKFFVTRKFGAEGWERFLKATPADDRRFLDMPSMNDWHDLVTFLRALHTLAETFQPGGTALVHEFGRYEAERDLNTVERLFLRLVNPATVVEKLGSYWSKFNDYGEWTVTREGPKVARAVFDASPQPDPIHCAELMGYLGRVMELCGGREVTVEHTECRGQGGSHCTFVGRWA